MRIQLEPTAIGAELTGWDFDREPEAQSVANLRQALLNYHVLLIRGKNFEPSELVAFSKLFGSTLGTTSKNFWHSQDYPEVFRITNAPTQISNCGCEDWHCDGHYRLDAFGITINNAVQAAGGGITICDMHKIYEKLSESDRKALSYVRCLNSSGVYHPLVRRHPGTGRVGFYINMYAESIDPAGNKIPAVDRFIKGLLERSAHRHEWQDGDILILDNFAVTHRACPGDPANLEVVQRCQTIDSSTFWRHRTEPARQPCAAQPVCC